MNRSFAYSLRKSPTWFAESSVLMLQMGTDPKSVSLNASFDISFAKDSISLGDMVFARCSVLTAASKASCPKRTLLSSDGCWSIRVKQKPNGSPV